MEIQSTTRQPGSTLTHAQYEKVRAQAEELEGVFLNTLTKQLFTSIKTDEQSMGGGFGEDTWRSMQAEYMASSMAQNGGLGLAEQLLPDLLVMQEAANNQNKLPGAYK